MADVHSAEDLTGRADTHVGGSMYIPLGISLN